MRSYAVTFLGYSVGDAWGCGGVRVIYAPIVPATKKGIFERHIVQRSYAALLSSVLGIQSKVANAEANVSSLVP